MSRAILVNEDEAVLAKNMCTYLERHDYDVECAGSAEEGLSLLKSFAPDVVLLSVPFPGAVYAAFRIAQTIKAQDARIVSPLLAAKARPDAVTNAAAAPLLLAGWFGTVAAGSFARGVGTAIMAVFLLRGIAGFLPAWRRKHPLEPFATLDGRMYSPLCLAVAAGYAVLLLQGV